MVWDAGSYQAINTKDTTGSLQAMRRGLRAGQVSFVLAGEKLKGEFTLIKLKKTKGGKAWLLIKKADEFARQSDILKQDQSVLSGQSWQKLKTTLSAN
jgi:bifunctional non-homologous end joining protein LigD